MGLLQQVRFLAVLLVGVVVTHARPELLLEGDGREGVSAGRSLQQQGLPATAAVRLDAHLVTDAPVVPLADNADGHLVKDKPALPLLDITDGHVVPNIPALPSPDTADGHLVTDTPVLSVTDPIDGHIRKHDGNIPAFPVPNSLDYPAPAVTSPQWPVLQLYATQSPPEWGNAVANVVGAHLPAGEVVTAEAGTLRPATGLALPPGHQQAQSGHRHHPCHPGLHRPGRCEATASVRWAGEGTRVFCSGGLHKISRTRSHKTMVLVLCYWPEDTFDPSMLTMFERLERLRVTDSNITEVLDFPYHEHLQELVLSGLRLTWLGDDIFMGLRRLRVLDLSRNHLSSLDSACVLRLPSLQQLLLAGNPWRCTLRLSWLTEPSARRLVADPDGMQCGAALWPRRPVMPVITLLKRVSDECPSSGPCSCELTGVVRDARKVPRDLQRVGPGSAGELLPIITVNCSHRSLGAMPASLPTNTTTLLLRGNKITSVRPLVDRHASVLDVYLDDNQVESIADLEGSPWLANFRVLSLRANKLQQLPTYALDNALERNDHVVRVYLGLNPWRCDCQFTPTFQELLAKYKPLIQDWDDIRCAAVEGDENSMKKIHALSRGAVCREEGEPRVSTLDMVNAALGVSLVAVLAKLAFDFWRYRRYGRLPWIATKLP